MQDDEIRTHLKELDAGISKEGALVSFEVYGGGPDESRIVGTRNGFLRLGVELLKGGLQEPDAKNQNSIHVDLDYLTSDESAICFDWFERRTDLRKEPPRNVRQRAIEIAMSTIFFAALALMVLGFFTLIRWIIN